MRQADTSGRVPKGKVCRKQRRVGGEEKNIKITFRIERKSEGEIREEEEEIPSQLVHVKSRLGLK